MSGAGHCNAGQGVKLHIWLQRTHQSIRCKSMGWLQIAHSLHSHKWIGSIVCSRHADVLHQHSIVRKFAQSGKVRPKLLGQVIAHASAADMNFGDVACCIHKALECIKVSGLPNSMFSSHNLKLSMTVDFSKLHLLCTRRYCIALVTTAGLVLPSATTAPAVLYVATYVASEGSKSLARNFYSVLLGQQHSEQILTVAHWHWHMYKPASSYWQARAEHLYNFEI